MHIKCGRWEDNIGVDLKETGWESMNWIHLAQDKDKSVTNTAMNFQVP
jgi:hypothetical protein